MTGSSGVQLKGVIETISPANWAQKCLLLQDQGGKVM